MQQPTATLPKDLVLGVTYWCNSRCIMCDIWKMKPKNEWLPEDLRVLPSTFRDINISGGEPFLRADLVEIIRVVKEQCPKARIVISSNGFLPDLIEQRMKEILTIDPEIGVGISIDGFGEMHEKVRRIPHAFEKSMATLHKLKNLGMTNLRIGFTIVDENVHDVMKMYRVAQEISVDFTLAYAQSSENYFGGIQVKHDSPLTALEHELSELISQQLKSKYPKQWFRAYFSHGILEFARSRQSVLPTRAGRDHCYIDSWGNVFPSVAHNLKLGNIREQKDFQAIWNSNAASEARASIDENPRSAWMVCTARSAIKRNLPAVGWWITKNKMKSVLKLGE